MICGQGFLRCGDLIKQYVLLSLLYFLNCLDYITTMSNLASEAEEADMVDQFFTDIESLFQKLQTYITLDLSNCPSEEK